MHPAKTEDVLFALGSVACHTGKQAGALLIIIQLLARSRRRSESDCGQSIETGAEFRGVQLRQYGDFAAL